jgi:hypothetical protein
MNGIAPAKAGALAAYLSAPALQVNTETTYFDNISMGWDGGIISPMTPDG